jgi:hypothetical protein
MKKTRLLEIIREEINEALNVLVTNKKGETTTMPYNTPDEKKSVMNLKQDNNITNIETTAGQNIKEDDLNEVPDFGGRFDQKVAAKYGEEDTLEAAMEKVVNRTLSDRGISKVDVAKMDKNDLKDLLRTIRQQISGKGQTSAVAQALKKQIEFDDSGSKLQDNQTNNAILKALGLVTPKPRGRKADPNKPEKPASTGKKGRPAGAPKAEKVATRTSGDDGFDKVEYSDDEESVAAAKAAGSDETAKELGSTPEEKKVKFNQFLASVKKNKDDKAKIDGILKLAKDKFKFAKTMMDDLKRAAGRDVEA